jgi:hypothetical protein
MPYKVVEEDGKYCVYKHDAEGNPVGKSHGCHPTRDEANGQMRALYANEGKELDGAEVIEATNLWRWVKGLFAKDKPVEVKKDNTFLVWKEGTTYRWLTAYSNKFRDDDHPPEILSDEAHKGFVETVDKGEWPYPELWLWHVKGSRSGAADYVAYDGAFALASGTFDADKQDVAEKLSGRDDLLTSHGMPMGEIERDKEDSTIITRYRTTEISVLPDYAAANKYTPFTIVKEVDMALPDHKRAFLAEILGNEKAAEVEAQLEAKGKELEEKVEFKEETVVVEPVVEAPKYVTADEVVEAVAGNLKPLYERIEILAQAIDSMGKEMKQMKVDEDEKLKNLVQETPAASLFARISSAVGAKETEIDGRSSLAKSGPKETFSNAEGPSSVPIINEYLTRRG